MVIHHSLVREHPANQIDSAKVDPCSFRNSPRTVSVLFFPHTQHQNVLFRASRHNRNEARAAIQSDNARLDGKRLSVMKIASAPPLLRRCIDRVPLSLGSALHTPTLHRLSLTKFTYSLDGHAVGGLATSHK
jgi:hypothetical protein